MIFKEAESLNGVSKFHETFGLPVLKKPTVPNIDRCKLRISLLEEELRELKEALENNDIIEAADACADLQYVLSGAIHEFGLGMIFSDLFAEVQRSNMSKTCKSIEEASATQKFYKEKKDTDSYIEERSGEYLVKRQDDGKVLKSINYSPADLKRIIMER